MRLTIDTRGRVSQCDIAESSGFSKLDQGSCDFWSERMRYTPGTDENGDAVEAVVAQEIVWVLRDAARRRGRMSPV